MVLLLGFLLAPAAAAAQPAPPCAGCLLGEPTWRVSLARKGVTLEPAITYDLVAARAGGRSLGSGGLGLAVLGAKNALVATLRVVASF